MRATDSLAARPSVVTFWARAISAWRRSSIDRLVRLRPCGEVDGVGGLRFNAYGQILVDFFRDEGYGRGQELGDSYERVMQGRQGGCVAVPEAAAVETYIPVAELVDEVGDWPCGGSDVVGLIGGGHVAYEPV